MVRLLLWIIMKCYRWKFGVGKMEWFVPLEGGANPVRLIEKLERLEYLSAYGARRSQRQDDGQQPTATEGEHPRELATLSKSAGTVPVVQ